MVIIKINKIYIKIAAAVILIVFLGCVTIKYFQNVSFVNGCETAFYMEDGYGTTSLAAFVASINTTEYGNKGIEIFDIDRGEVIKRVQASKPVQKEVSDYIRNIRGIYSKVKAFPDRGYIIRIPLSPPIKAENKWLYDYNIEEVFILFPQGEEPYLMILDDKARPFFYNFEGDTNVLIKLLDF